jgi:hypothetical protein
MRKRIARDRAERVVANRPERGTGTEPVNDSAAIDIVAIVDQIDREMSHAWMVRTFVKHSEEAESFPELMQVVRTIFDVSRALETRRGDPPGYVRMLQKKLGKLRAAAEQFRHDAPIASSHTNFQQAVRSLDGCIASLEALLARAQTALAQPAR